MVSIILHFIFLILGIGGGYFLFTILGKKNIETREKEIKKILSDAKEEAERIKRKADLDAKEMLYKLRLEFDKNTAKKREELYEFEKRLSQREENLEKRLDFIEEKDKELNKREEQLKILMAEVDKKNKELEEIVNKEKEALQRISSLTPQEARTILLNKFEEEMRTEKAIMFKNIVEEVQEKAQEKSKEILVLSMQKCAVEYTTENTVGVVQLPNDEMKGRVIGREGRNIRAFEMATGVDLVIDDTPGAVAISSFDPIRREIARLSLETLVSDGRIHPTRIEEVVEKVKRDFEKNILNEGRNAAFEVGVHDLHNELFLLLGKLKYRTSYGQNVLQHSKEVAAIMGVLASELGLDARIAKRGGLLHDIGKAVDHQVEGTHAQIGANLLRKYGESEIIVNIASAHHEEVEFKSIYASLALIADAISASRPGARRETLETYLQRLKSLEEIANSFSEVEKSYAIQAGREIRVIVLPNKIKEEELPLLANDIKKRIEKELDYPGQIKITIIREVRHVEYAK